MTQQKLREVQLLSHSHTASRTTTEETLLQSDQTNSFYLLDQGLANCGSLAKSSLFWQSFVGEQPHLFIYILLEAAFVLQWQSWAVETEAIGFTKIFTIWPFPGKSVLSLCYSHTTGPHSSQSPATWEFPLPSSGAECREWGAGFPGSGEAEPLHGRQGGSQSMSTLWGTPDPEPAPGKSVSYFLHEATKIWGF